MTHPSPSPDFSQVRAFMRDRCVTFAMLAQALGCTRPQARAIFIYGTRHPAHLDALRALGWPEELMPADRSPKLPGLSTSAPVMGAA